MQSSPEIIEKMKQEEGFSPVIYWDGGSPGVGTKTIGFGTTPADVSPLPEHLTPAQASALFIKKLRTKYEPFVDALHLENQNQYDACMDAVYNLGTGIVGPGYTLGRALIARDWSAAARAFLLYVRANGVIEPGLVTRRYFESALFITPDPHGYRLLDRTVRTGLIKNRSFSEHETAIELDRLQKHLRLHPVRVRRLRQNCGALATRLEQVASDGHHHIHYDAKLDQAWRHAQMSGRARGRQYVK